MAAEFFYGTSSWTAKGWERAFYPPGMKPGEYLRHYATRFRAVECDATWYAVPGPLLVRGWVHKTHDGFRLAAKFPRSIVHGGEAAKPDPDRILRREDGDDTSRFLDAMRFLGPRCGPLVLQFPYFNRSAFKGAEPFLRRLDEYMATLPEGFRYAVETRNADWLAPPLLDVLRRRRAALVLVDLAYLPHPAEVAERLDVVTADFAYLRLIGDRAAVEAKTKVFDRTVLDQGPRLARHATLIRGLLAKDVEVHAFANNHYAGYAPETIEALAAAVRAG
jgi:uncharacterized protein YecE (DUF72 family)